ncbi:MAG: hypothetical protein BJ554DRAFT_5657 [Olpidium bornovanus]|uniref:Uncharacterized protein n=1 Tax=Olpidium bornovanus TaxID=278681 RepID=A0A8H7ZZ21_9FUNG|nr:MAG: hypothetical protein BJ554DRAFT_5657 [Olpidium bornovanus]
MIGSSSPALTRLCTRCGKHWEEDLFYAGKSWCKNCSSQLSSNVTSRSCGHVCRARQQGGADGTDPTRGRRAPGFDR